MNSLDLKSSRYVGGGITETANNRLEWWERTIFSQDVTDVIYTVENFYEGRLDLIALAFLNDPRYWWVIAQLNNILDPVTEITAGRKLIIPTVDRLNLMLNKKTGGIASKKIPISEISSIIL